MSMYNVGDHVIVDSHTGAERVVCTISEVLLVDEPIQKGITPLGAGPRLRYRAGSRIIRPEEIHGHAFNRPNNYGGMREQPSVSSTGGAKNVKPEKFSLIPTQALAKVAEHYGVGAEKYAAHQWRQGYEWSKSYDALQRHANAFWAGEDNDPETKTPHMAAVAFHALTLLTFMDEHPNHDDRYKEAK